MSDYIKREDAIKKIEKITIGAMNTILTDEAKRKAAEALFADIPSADVVEVVRCKDCEYWDDHERCDFWSSLMSPHYPEKNDYCSYGERADA